MSNKKKGTLIIIGGHEDKIGNKIILEQVARFIGSGKLVITTVAAGNTHEYPEDYVNLFRNMGIKHIHNLSIQTREEGLDESKARILDDATGVFFIGGDQLKITSRIGDTPIYNRIKQIYEEEGGLVAGTSAGASVVCETMLVEGDGDDSHKIGATLRMASGLGLIGGVIIDQHFAQRGRMGRMLGAVAQNPANIGIGIDEDTAIVVEKGQSFYVLGSGAVYVFDCAGVTDSNIAVEEEGCAMSIYDVKLHTLSQGDSYDLAVRRPKMLSSQQFAQRFPEFNKEPEKTKAKGGRG